MSYTITNSHSQYPKQPSYWIFNCAIASFILFNWVSGSLISHFLGGLRGIFLYLSFGVILGLCIFSIILNFKKSVLNILLLLSLSITSVLIFVNHTDYVVASVLLLPIVSKIPFETVVSRIMKGTVIYLAVPFILSLIGILENRAFIRHEEFFGSGIAYSFGFAYYSGFSYPAMGILICQTYLWRNQLKLKKLVILIVYALFIFFVSYTRLQILTCLALILSFYLINKFNIHFGLRIFKWIALTVYPLLCYTTYITASEASLSSELNDFNEINKEYYNGRLALNEIAFKKYDVLPWGQEIESTGGKRFEEYFYLDSGYARLILQEGYVLSCLLMFGYSLIFYRAWKSNNPYLYSWLLWFSIMNTFNSFLIEIFSNPVILLLFMSSRTIQQSTITCYSKPSSLTPTIHKHYVY